MAGPRRFEIDDILIRPGTYFNPETEVLIVVDDTPQLETEVAESGEDEGEWLLVADEIPIDEQGRDELLEAFSTRFHPGSSGAVTADEDDLGEDEPEIEPDPEE